MNKQTIYQEVSALLVSLFELTPDQITPEARLYEELGLDSIDAVDMVVHLQKKSGIKFSRKYLNQYARCRILSMQWNNCYRNAKCQWRQQGIQ